VLKKERKKRHRRERKREMSISIMRRDTLEKGGLDS
jgi:hypothetical protein